MSQLIRDTRYALRAFVQSPGFTITAVLTLALGIGATTAIFTVVDQVTLRPLPVEEPDRLALLRWNGAWRGSNTGYASWSYPWYEDLRDHNEVFEELIARHDIDVSFGFAGEASRINAELVTGNYFRVLGLNAVHGRLIGADDDRIPDGHPVAVLSHDLWRERFGSDPGAVGESIQLNGRAFDVIGVAPEGFRGMEFGTPAGVFVPIVMKKSVSTGWAAEYYDLVQRRQRWTNVFGRLKSDLPHAEAATRIQPFFKSLVEYDLAQPEMSDASARLRTRYRQAKVDVLPGAQGVWFGREDAQAPMATLMAMVCLLLLTACANIANLSMARGAGRAREFAIRLAVGAGRLRLIRQLMVESVMLALVGGALGVVVAAWTTSLLVWLIPDEGAAAMISATPDPRMLAFTAAVAMVTPLIFGLVPAFQSARVKVATTLKDQAGAIAGGNVGLRKALVGAQIFLSLVLLTSAGLFVRTLENLRNVEPGFDIERTLVFSLAPAKSGYSEQSGQAFLRTLRDRLRGLPGVEDAGFSHIRLLSGDRWDSGVSIEGYKETPGEDMNPWRNFSSAGYLSSLDIPVLEGRDFRDSDDAGAPMVAIVNRKFAERYFDGKSPVGRRMGFGRELDTEIIGLMPDIRYGDMREEIPRQVMIPYAQMEGPTEAHFYVRTGGAPLQLAETIQQAVRGLDANIPVYGMRTMSVQLETTLVIERVLASLAAGFGVIAALLAGLGLYGVLSFSMVRRKREIGLRIALGAQRFNIAGLAFQEVVRVFGLAALLALPASLALAKICESQLFGVSPFDPTNAAAAVIVLGAVALASSLLPAWRGSRIEPMEALRLD